jgi:hypothetical protein
LMLNSKLATIIDAQLKACHFHYESGKLWVEYKW